MVNIFKFKLFHREPNHTKEPNVIEDSMFFDNDGYCRFMDPDYNKTKQYKEYYILTHMRPARVRDYDAWLDGFMAKGGKITHKYNYKMPDDFYVALQDTHMIPLYGAQSISIIVPVGIEITGELGHVDLFYMGNFKPEPSHFVPVYIDNRIGYYDE